jgi:hypothetical protein
MAFSYCLNTSTIRSDGATVLDMINTTATAGYDGIEPWVEELDDWIAGGGTLEQVRDHAASKGVAIVNLIGFPEWAVPEDDRRAKGLEEAGRCFEMARLLHCPYVAAPPIGIHDREVELLPVADRFAALVDLAGLASRCSPMSFTCTRAAATTVASNILVGVGSGWCTLTTFQPRRREQTLPMQTASTQETGSRHGRKS